MTCYLELKHFRLIYTLSSPITTASLAMHNLTTDSSMNVQNLLPDTALPAASIHTPPPTPKETITQITETNRIKKCPNSKPTSDDKNPKAPHRPPAYTSFSTFGLEEPEDPKSLETPRKENPALVASAPPTAMEQIKNVLGLEQPQK
ncbi:3913f153-486d-4293-ab4c-7f7089fa60b3 [Sclerotinia trifoliorum]|uniref:3913f153-486d-4293-ab4c-7f7089fa60b3 n=1 Tax=Sclerotinia trifoliorum TaxID=28548 RepID=A0A8H2W3T2_9HELO|nr:3913f153-486d-4293-ab4c-7f7089fa60b3 [Sclerotinia trifoliorum]